MTAASSAKATSTPHTCDAAPAAARMNACPTRLVATRSPSAEPRLVSSTRSTTQSMVVVCERPSAKPRTDIAIIIGARLWLNATMSRQVAATVVAITVSFSVGIRRTNHAVAARANNAPLELMPNRMPTWEDVRPTAAPSSGR